MAEQITRAIFQGSYADLKNIKTRGVVQIVVEVPHGAEADHALKVLGGLPQAGKEVWLAVARLDPKAAPRPQEKPEKPKGDSLRVQACIASEDRAFAIFLRERYPAAWDGGFSAAENLRKILRVNSRKELDTDPEAAARWHRLNTEFQVWAKQ